MKNYIKIIITFLIFTSIHNSTLAYDKEDLLNQKIILTRYQVTKDYENGKALNNKIAIMFGKLVYKNDIMTILKIKQRMEIVLIKLREKENLSENERKILNLATNIYLRAVKELELKK